MNREVGFEPQLCVYHFGMLIFVGGSTNCYIQLCYIQLGGFQKIPQFFTQSDQHSSTNMPARGTMAADDDHFDEEVCEELSLELVAQELPLDPSSIHIKESTNRRLKPPVDEGF